MTDKKTWGFSNLHELHSASNALLRQAILNERYKRWRKVTDLYKELLWMISLERLPNDYEPPSSYTMLLYELHFHLGVAYQHLNDHRKAIKHFSKTIEVVSIAKNGCLAGCLTNSCLMTPIYARRAFAHANLGSYRMALKDAEKAVVLDSKSPDVYCIRALVYSTFDEELVGLKDLDKALEINKDHVCAIMLKASFTKPLAIRLCEEAETYLTCNSFSHSCIIEFYDKFLFPLSVPHTITVINLTPEKPSKKQLEQLEKHRRQEVTKKRAQSSIVRPGQRFARPESTAMTLDARRPVTAPLLRTEASPAQSRPQSSSVSSTLTPDATDSRIKNDNSKENTIKPAKPKKFEIETPSDYSIPVFQATNIKFAPRMYYRPWIGDKLPATERAPANFSPKFY